MRLTWPLVGRSTELQRIQDAILDRDSSGVVVCGAAGVGKSRVVREALDWAASAGYEVRWIVGTSSARMLPLGALAQWAEPAGNDSLAMVSKSITALSSPSPGRPMVLGVDDASLLDDLSTFVVHQIIQRGAAKVVLTLRDTEPIPAATLELSKAGQFDRLDLKALTRADIAPLVSATVGGPLDPNAAERLWTLTRGNPLYLRTIVEHEIAEGRLTAASGYWRWIGEPVVPPSLVQLIQERIGTLPPGVSDVVDALAVGEPIELESLRRLAAAAAVEEADLRGLITLEQVAGRVEVRLAHPLYGEVRRSRAAPTRLRRLRGKVATELATSDDADDMRLVVRRATLSLDSDLDLDPDLLVRAAEGAVWLSDLPLADRLANAAIDAGGGAQANFIRAHALSWLSRGEEADAVLAQIPSFGFTDADRARLIFLRAVNMMWTLADPGRAKEYADDAGESVPTSARSCIDAFSTVYWAAMGRPGDATQSSRGLNLDVLPHVVAAVTTWAVAVASGDAGRAGEAENAARSGYLVATQAYDAAHMRFAIADGHIRALILCGRIGAALDAAEQLRQQAADLPGAAQLFSTALTACAAAGAGRLDTASSLFAPVVSALVAAEETNGWGYRYQLPYTIALAMQGRAAEASIAIAAAERRRHPSWRFIDWEHAIAAAWVSASQGTVSEAIATARRAAEIAATHGQFAAEVVCLQTATQFGDRSCSARLRELTSIVEGPRAGLAATFAEALDARNGPELAAVSKGFEGIGDLVAAVDAAAHAAAVYRRTGLRGSVLACATRVADLAEQCGGALTPAIRTGDEQLPLTDREREVVMLVAERLSNRAIAAQLHVSVRTVENHIFKAMAKTGTADRNELASLLARHRRRGGDAGSGAAPFHA